MSSSNPVGRSLARTSKKVEVPRPLKDTSLSETRAKSSLSLSTYSVDSAEKLVALMDMVVNSIRQLDSVSSNSEITSSLTANIANLCKYLKIFGPQLENSAYLGQLDRAFLVFREYMVRPGLKCEARANLLEIVELRLCNWIPRKTSSPFGSCPNLMSPYQFQGLDYSLDVNDTRSHSRHTPLEATTHLGTDELLVRSGKYCDKSTKYKNYFKDEIIIRNSDSGKVMGIQGRRLNMIEMLSETIISFQRVSPMAKERLVQIMGSSEEKISHATRLIEDTIRNKAPIKCGSDSSFSGEDTHDFHGKSDLDAEFSNDYVFNTVDKKLKIPSIHSLRPYQYKHKVIVRNCHLTITGDDYNYVTVAKAVLDDYFSKLRASELPDEDLYGNEVFADNVETNGTFDNNFISVVPPPVPERSSSIPDSNDNNLFSEDVPEASSILTPHMWGNYISSSTSNENLSTFAALNIDFKLKSKKSLTNVPLIKSRTISTNFQTSASLDDGTGQRNVMKNTDDGKQKIKYSKEFLLLCRKSQSSREKPVNWELISRKFPQIVDSNR